MASTVQAAHGLPIPEQVVAVARLHNRTRRGREVFSEALRQVLGKVPDLRQRSTRLLWRQAGTE